MPSDDTRTLFESMSTEELSDLREAELLDIAAAIADKTMLTDPNRTIAFCEARISLIDEVLAARKSER